MGTEHSSIDFTVNAKNYSIPAAAGNICRCTGYVKIIRAVQRAAALLREERRQISIEEIYPDSACRMGDPAPRVDGLQKATGALKFADDLSFEGMLYTKVLGCPFSRIIVQSADSKRDPWGGMTTASRQTFVTGNAVYYMACALKEKISGYLAALYNLDADNIVIEGLSFVERDNSRELISIADFAKKLKEKGEKIFAEYRYAAPETHFSLKEPSSGYQSGEERLHAAYCFAAQAVILQVNEKSGQVKVFKVIAASDTGKPVNPQAVEGQMEGG